MPGAKKPKKPVKSTKAQAAQALSDAAIEQMWLAMRHEFESTPIGIRELARKFGQKSHTTVLRRQQRDGWRKDPSQIAATVATEAVIDTLLAEPPSAPVVQDGAQGGASDAISPPSSALSVPDFGAIIEETAKKTTSRTASALSIANQSGAVRAGQRMALVQQQHIMREIAKADQVIEVSTKLMDLLSNILTCTDEVEVRARVAQIARIGKAESFSGLLRSAFTGIEKGLAMRRRALAMDSKGGVTAAADGADIPEAVKSLLPTMPIEQLMELRRTSAMLNQQMRVAKPKEHADALEGVATEILDGGHPVA